MKYHFKEDIIKRKVYITALLLVLFAACIYFIITNSYKYSDGWLYVAYVSGFACYLTLIAIWSNPNKMAGYKALFTNLIFYIVIFIIIFIGKQNYFRIRFNKTEKIKNIAIVSNVIYKGRYEPEKIEIEYKLNHKIIKQRLNNDFNHKVGDTLKIIHSVEDPELFKLDE